VEEKVEEERKTGTRREEIEARTGSVESLRGSKLSVDVAVRSNTTEEKGQLELGRGLRMNKSSKLTQPTHVSSPRRQTILLSSSPSSREPAASST